LARPKRGSVTEELESMSKGDVALATMKQGFGCAQSVFAAFAEEVGVDRDTALRIAGPFGGGIGGLGRTCGALTGAAMVVGAQYGRTDPGDTEKKLDNNACVRELIQMLERRHGTTICREILNGYDISDPEQWELARQEGLFESGCETMVRDAADVLEQLLARWYGIQVYTPDSWREEFGADPDR
jgi:C_GCAxxG_C_C family probable redox protein